MTLHHLAYETEAHFDAPCAAVYDAATLPSQRSVDPHQPGAILSATPVWGKPGEVGHQVIGRFNWGSVDLEMTESTLLADRPLALTIAQRPDRFTPYDPKERLPPIDSEVPARLDRLFDRTYGNPPVITEIALTFSPHKGGTTVKLAIAARTTIKPGWFKARRWHKNVPQEAAAIMARIGEALQVQ